MIKKVNILQLLLNILHIIFIKIHYLPGTVQVDFIQFFDRNITIKVLNKGKIIIDRGVTTRANVSFWVDSGELFIGNGCFFNSNGSITCLDSIRIGKNCSFGPNVVIVDHDHNFKGIGDEMFTTAPISIGNNVWIGANTVILKGAIIGDDSVVAAGSIVNKNIPQSHIFIQPRETKIERIRHS